jgi:hypothetical protein
MSNTRYDSPEIDSSWEGDFDRNLWNQKAYQPSDGEIINYFYEKFKPLHVEKQMLATLQEAVNLTRETRKPEAYARYYNGEVGNYTWGPPVQITLSFKDLTEDRQTKLLKMELGDKPRPYVYKDKARTDYHRAQVRSGNPDTSPVILQQIGNKYHILEGHHRIMARFYDLPRGLDNTPIGTITMNAYIGKPTNTPVLLDPERSIKRIASEYILKVQASEFNKTKLREYLKDPATRKKIIDFIEAICGYQSPSGDYWKETLAEVYQHIPEDFKKYLSVPPAKLKKLHRGADGKSPRDAISWTRAEHLARFFGHYHYRYSALQSHGGTIDSAKLVKICDNVKELYDYQIGDDEDEVIILYPVWKDKNPEILE